MNDDLLGLCLLVLFGLWILANLECDTLYRNESYSINDQECRDDR